MKLALFLLSLVLALPAQAESYRAKRDNAGWTHYYDSSGSQRCISKRDAAGYTHAYCR